MIVLVSERLDLSRSRGKAERLFRRLGKYLRKR